MGITQYRLAKSIGVPQGCIGEIVAGKRSITAETALRLASVKTLRPQWFIVPAWLGGNAGGHNPPVVGRKLKSALTAQGGVQSNRNHPPHPELHCRENQVQT